MATVVGNLADALGERCELRVLNNMKTTPVDRSLLRALSAQLRLLAQLARLSLFWRPQIVHIHTCSWFTFWRNAVDVLLVRLLGCKVVLHVHGGQFHKFLASLSPVQVILVRFVFRWSSRVLVLGEGWKRLFDRWCDPDRVVIVPNGVPLRPPIDIGRDRAFTILCLANYEEDKGQQDLLRAAAALHCETSVRVLLLGFESQAGRQDELQMLAESLGMSGRVEIPGPVVGEAKWEYFGRATCFCLPSYAEGLPMSMLEAMASALPVVVTRVGAIPEAVRDQEEGLIYEPGDLSGLSDCLQSLIDDREWAQRIGGKGRERLIRDFSLQRSADLVEQVYRGLQA